VRFPNLFGGARHAPPRLSASAALGFSFGARLFPAAIAAVPSTAHTCNMSTVANRRPQGIMTRLLFLALLNMAIRIAGQAPGVQVVAPAVRPAVPARTLSTRIDWAAGGAAGNGSSRAGRAGAPDARA